MKGNIAGAQRFLALQTIKKEPITVCQLEPLVASKSDSMASLHNIRSVVICSLAFAAFLRFNELAKLVRSEDDMLKLFIQSGGTDQYRDGASSRKATCPVAMMNRYLDRAGLSCDCPFFASFPKLNVVISLDLKV